MANDQQLGAPAPARSEMRLRGLVAFLKRAGCRMENLPTGNPLIDGATLSELRQAFRIVEKESRSDLENAYRKMAGGAQAVRFGPQDEDFMPLNTLRWRKLIDAKTLVTDTSLLFCTEVDVFQVNFQRWFTSVTGVTRVLLLVQSLVTKQPGEWFRISPVTSGIAWPTDFNIQRLKAPQAWPKSMDYSRSISRDLREPSELLGSSAELVEDPQKSVLMAVIKNLLLPS